MSEIVTYDDYDYTGTLSNLILQVSNEHAELRTPVAHVVKTEHVMAWKLKNTRQTVTDDSWSKMPDVHFC